MLRPAVGLSLAAVAYLAVGLTAAEDCEPVWWQFPADELDGTVHAMVVFDEDGSGPGEPALYVGGAFQTAGGITVERIARWDGTSWSPLSQHGMNSTVFALTVFDPDGPGPEPAVLCAGGNFTSAGNNNANRVAKWDGSRWSALGAGFDRAVYALGVFDEDGAGPQPPTLYAGGLFVTSGGVLVNHIARWDGVRWSALGRGVNDYVQALTTFDEDGDGVPALFAAGAFTEADGIRAMYIARWNGSAWSVLGPSPHANGLNGRAHSLCVHDEDGPGPLPPALYVGGAFTAAGGENANRVAKWDGEFFSTLGSGVDNTVRAVASFDADADGPLPPDLYASGYFTSAGGTAANYIARWDGSTWSALDEGLDNAARAMASFDDDPNDSRPAALHVGGEFTTAGGLPSGRIAAWGRPAAPWIVTHPQSQTVCDGDAVSFTVVAEGTEPLGYQWRKDGQPIPGAVEQTHTIDPVRPEDAGSYDVVVTDPCGSAVSDPATLTVELSPRIVEQPQSQTVCEGDAATFSVLAEGLEPLTYQWRKDGQPIDGATGSEYTVDPVTPDAAGQYDVVVTNACGTVTSDPATLSVAVAPGIVWQPQDQTACEGQAASFSVGATGTEPLSYQWRKDGADIPGATGPTFTIDPVTPDDAGLYDVVVSNLCGTITSDPATLTVETLPVINTQPQSQTVCEGEAVSFEVAAEGSPPLSYQWRKDGQPIDGAIEPQYTIDPVTPEDAGVYDVVVTNPCGTVTSDPASLTVELIPRIVTQPQPQAACEGDAASFSVVATGATPLSYQWRKDGADIPGATGPTFMIDPVTPDDAGLYDVVVSNHCGAVTSDSASLTVEVGPTILEQPQSQTACAGDAVTLSVVATGSAPLGYQWRKDGVEISGANQPDYTLDPVTADDAGLYDIVVSNACGTVISDVAELVVNLAPTIVADPQSQRVCEGERVTFSVLAEGTEPLSYQWRKDGVEIPGADQDSYTIDAATPDDAGRYDVVVTNACGTATSAPATLTVETGPVIVEQPQSQTACAGDAAAFSVTAEGVGLLEYQWRKDGTPVPGATEATHVIDPVGPDDAGQYDVVVTDTCGSVVSDPATLTVDTGPMITTQPQSQTACVGGVATFSVVAEGAPPLSYQWRKDGLEIPGADEASYTIEPVGPEDAGEYDVVVGNPCGTVISEAATLEVVLGPVITLPPRSQSVCEGYPATFDVIAQGSEPLGYQWRKEGVPIPGATEAVYHIASVRRQHAGVYDVVVSNVCGEIISDPATLVVNEVPIIAEQPPPQWACLGESVTFTVAAIGSEPLSFQWRKDGEPIADATEPTYTIAALSPADAGVYDVVVSNPAGSTTSEPATLGVGSGPSISRQPQAQRACLGEAVSFSVGVEGPGPFEYQWRRDGEPVAGATEASYTLEVVAVGDAGQYDVVVSDECGTVTSSAATLTVEDCRPLPAEPTGPTPADGATAVPVEVELRWARSANATSYDVYLGTRQPLEWLGNTSSNRWSLAGLDFQTTYYWQVVAQSEGGSTAGPVWSFTTISLPPEEEQQAGQTAPPEEELVDEVMPPGCGAGACGAGAVGTVPLTFLALCGLKLRVAQRHRR